ncbi:MAG: CBS domain-containing protein [Bacteroidetes bacterium]|nr:MAG: CBS domain-containing protein [Bacteroidota bacterium]
MEKLPVVEDYMAKELLTLSPDMDIHEGISFLLDNKISGAPVTTEDFNMVGILSEKDCLRLLARGVDNQIVSGTVADFMTKNVITIPSNMDIYYCAGIFLKNYYRRLPVVDDGKLVGQISRRDLLRAIQEKIQ